MQIRVLIATCIFTTISSRLGCISFETIMLMGNILQLKPCQADTGDIISVRICRPTLLVNSAAFVAHIRSIRRAQINTASPGTPALASFQ